MLGFSTAADADEIVWGVTVSEGPLGARASRETCPIPGFDVDGFEGGMVCPGMALVCPEMALVFSGKALV